MYRMLVAGISICTLLSCSQLYQQGASGVCQNRTALVSINSDDASKIYAIRLTESGEEIIGGAQGEIASGNDQLANPIGVLIGENCSLPVVAWSQRLLEDKRALYVKGWDGKAWREMAGSASGDGLASAQSIHYHSITADSQGAIYVAWAENEGVGPYKIGIKKWNGGAWENLGSSAYPVMSGEGRVNPVWPQMAIGSTQILYLSFFSPPGINQPHEIYVWKFEAGVWTPLGAADGNVSNTPTTSSAWGSLAIGEDGAPIVGWREDLQDDQFEIYARRWNGSAWDEVAPGSASGNGISDEGRRSYLQKQIVTASGDLYVGWSVRMADQRSEIRIKRLHQGSWQSVSTPTCSADSTCMYPTFFSDDKMGLGYYFFEQDSQQTWRIGYELGLDRGTSVISRVISLPSL